MPVLRRGKAEVALLVALADIGGVWGLDDVMQALTRFADCAVKAAFDALLRDAERSGKLLGTMASENEGCGVTILALGKGGSEELNYSSDIDLVVFFDPAAPRLPPGAVPGPFYAKLTQALVKLLGERTADGYVLRVDLRLRPDPGSTAVAVSLPAAYNYYEALGQTWERAAFIKARPIAGDLELGRRFLRDLAPFVWRRYFDYAAIADIHSMKRQIQAFRGHATVAVAGHDVKVGRGGIREIEFFVQTQQLIYGGRRPALRGRRTLDMLLELAADGWIGQDAVEDLARAYRLLRRVEHRLQMLNDEQTQRLPAKSESLDRLALFAGFDDRAHFEGALLAAMHAVEMHYARLFEHSRPPDAETAGLIFSGVSVAPDTIEVLRRLGFKRPDVAAETIRGWYFGRRPSIRSARGREALTELVPSLLDAFSRSGDADGALAGFDRVVGRMPAAIELFGILRSNGALRQLYADVLGTAPRLASIVSTRPHLLDATIDPSLQRSPDAGEIEQRICQSGLDTELVLDRARDVAREEAFLIGLRLLSGTTAPARAGEDYSDLAVMIMRALLACVERDFVLQHGRIPGGVLAVVAMGKLGTREMTATSDLDLIVIYDVDEIGTESDGVRPLAASRYYARLTQRLIAALTSATSRGLLYSVDMRLRPSGSQGPLATRFSSFVQYHATEAETWERMALTRARVVAGDPDLGARVRDAIRTALTQPPRDSLGADVAMLRKRVEREKPPSGAWDVKLVPGGQLDTEFLAQYVVLANGPQAFEASGLATSAVLLAAQNRGFISSNDGDALATASNFFTDLTQVLRLCVDGGLDPAVAGEGLKRRLALLSGLPDFTTLERHLLDTCATVRAVFDRLLPVPS